MKRGRSDALPLFVYSTVIHTASPRSFASTILCFVTQRDSPPVLRESSPDLFIIVNDGVHKVHHRFGSAEYALHFVKPVVTLKETV